MSTLCKIYSLTSKSLLKEVEETRKDPFPFQVRTFNSLIHNGTNTLFGKEHHFSSISNYPDFQKQVALHQYDDLLPYIERIRNGVPNILWNQEVKWFAKSSGTSGTKSKFIPVPSQSLRGCHFKGMRTLLAVYLDNHPKSKLFNGKALTLGGSCRVDEMGTGKSRYGDLSAVLLSNSPPWTEWFRTPPKSMALQHDFERKVNRMAACIATQNITNFSGVPSWNLVLLRKVLAHTGKNNLLELWPNLELFMHGGISFEPYREQYNRLIPSPQMHYMETYNASEGFFALQDDPNDVGMLLLPNCGIFYEFIPMKRLEEALSGAFIHFDTMESVQKGVNYAIVISTNGGLWRYLIGDTVRFTSLHPHRIIITGRTKLFINAFGEELMIGHAEKALTETCTAHHAVVSEFTVAPVFMDERAKGAHEWLIEFETPPADLALFASDLDQSLCRQNSDYEAKRDNNATMLPLKIEALKRGCFYLWMEQRDKLGGQNKVPRLHGTRIHAEEILVINEKLKNAETHS